VRQSVYTDINATGTQHVLDACEYHGVERFVHCSTVGVHGHVSQVPADENAPFNPGDEYQRSKLDAEIRVWDWFARTSIPTTVVRPAGIHGPGDTRFLKLFRGIKRGYFVMLGSGQTLYHVVFIDDAIQMLVRAAIADVAVGEAFHACGPRYVTLNELVAIIAEVLGSSPPRLRLPVWPVYVAGALMEALFVPFGKNPPVYRRRVDFFTHDRAFSIEKARRLLGYDPQVNLEKGIRDTARWYQEQGFLTA
jgi:nucleoside-diphosphate-sugar epimerase